MSVSAKKLVYGHWRESGPFIPFNQVLAMPGEDGQWKPWSDRSVKGIEELEVPAGKYLAIRVEESALMGRTEPRSTTWYAAGIGEIKRVSFTGTKVLKSFTPGTK